MTYVLAGNEEEYERLRRQSSVGVVPPLESTDEFFRVGLGTFAGAGNGLQLGRHLPRLHHEAGIGAPDGGPSTAACCRRRSRSASPRRTAATASASGH